MSGDQEEYNETNQDGFQCPGEFFTKLNILGSDSWTFRHIMPGVVWHQDTAKEDGENAT
jgi:hypothetical protein